MSQIRNKFIEAATGATVTGVTGDKMRLNNVQPLRGRNAANSADVNIIQINSSNVIEMQGLLSMNSFKITNLATPTVSTDASTKGYVDTAVTGLGTVSSVGMTVPSFLSVSPATITSSGTFAVTLASQSANTVFAAPNGSSGAPTFRALVAADIPSLSSTYLPLAGGTMSGVITMGSNKITGLANGSAASDAVNYSQLTSLSTGLIWQTQINDPDLANDVLTSPPGSPAYSVVYIIGASPTGAWATYAGHAVWWDHTNWVDLSTGNYLSSGLGTAVQIGDRFGVTIDDGSGLEGGGLTGKHNQIAQVTGNTPGSFTYSFTTPVNNYAVSTLNQGSFTASGSQHYGSSITYNSTTSAWVNFSGPSKIVTGSALSYTGNTLNVGYDNVTIDLTSNLLEVKAGGVGTTQLAASSVTLAKMANLAANSIIGNNTGSSATPLALSQAQLTAMVNVFSSSLAGTVPASGGGTSTFLRADGTWASPSGSVSSVGLADSTNIFNITGTPVTSSGTLTLSSLKSQVANTFLAAPNGSSGAPTFRTIVAADIPTLNQNTTGTASNVTGTVAIGNGGTGQVTQQAAINALTGTQSAGKYLRSDGTNASLSSIVAADVPTLNQNTTGTAANITATSNATLTTLSALSLPGTQVTGNISGNAANVTGTVAIGNGGTGQTTAAAAFNALNPMTTTGDIIYESATSVASRLAIGSTNQVLTVIGGVPSWQTPAASGANTALSNLASVAINTSLLPASDNTINVGSAALRFATAYALTLSSATSALSVQSDAISGASGASGAVTVQSGLISNASNGSSSGVVTIQSGNNAGTGATGTVYVQSGNQTNGGISGDIDLLTGTSTSSSGYAYLRTGSSAGGSTGNVSIASGQVSSGAGSSGIISINSGSMTSTSTGSSGQVNIGTGSQTNASSSSNGSPVLISTGNISGTGNSGNITLTTGTVTSGTRGVVGITARALNLPSAVSDPSVSSAADTYYNSTSNLIKFYNGSAWTALSTGSGITALTGDVTASGSGSVAATIASNAVTNAKAAQMAANTIKGNNTGSTANASDLTVAQVNAILPVFTSTLNGLAPLSGGGTSNFLRADGTWTAPTGSFTNPMTTLGDIIYENATPAPARLAGNTTAAKQFLTQTGTGTISAAPAWGALVSGDIPNNAANTSGSAGSVSGTNVITNSNLSQMPTLTIKGNNTGGTANALDLTVAQVNTMLGVVSNTPNKQTFVLASGDITNQYIDLAQIARTNSIIFMVQGSGYLLEGASYDYSVNYTGGVGGKTRITFLNDLASGGNAALVASDVVQVNYAY